MSYLYTKQTLLQTIKSNAGQLFILEKTFEGRTKWLLAIASLVFLGPAVQWSIVFFLEPDNDGGRRWMLLLMAVVFLFISIRFLLSAMRRDTLLITADQLILTRNKGLRSKKEIFEKADIINLRYVDKPVLSDHPLAGKTFDYLGFQTQQKLIAELYGDDRVAFDYGGRTVSFGRRLYSWDFDTIRDALTGRADVNDPAVDDLYPVTTLQDAHRHSIFHEAEIKTSGICGCFFCEKIFTPQEIKEWVDHGSDKGTTALCPYCGIDAVIGDDSGFPVTEPEFLRAMHRFWF